MGRGSWDASVYDDRQTSRLMDGVSGTTTRYTKAISAGIMPAKCHPNLDPKGIKVRESRDSDTHPNSTPIIVVFDQTGSMGEIPVILQKNLGQLMALTETKGVVSDPQILFGAIGDARNHERAPIQFGQFESDTTMDENLDQIYLENNGGGNRHESYDLAMYLAARHTSTDSFEKRGKKGYFFMFGDEQPYSEVSRAEILKYIGTPVEADVPLEQIVAELKEKWEPFFILPAHSQYGTKFEDVWRKHFGENVLVMESPEGASELIAATIALNEGYDLDTVAKDLASVGADKNAIVIAKNALGHFSKKGGLSKHISTFKMPKMTGGGVKKI